MSGETGLGSGDWERAMANSKLKIQEAPPKPPMPGYPQKCLKRIKRRIKSSAFNSQSTVEGARHSVQSIEEQFRPDILSPDFCSSKMKVHPEMLMKTKDGENQMSGFRRQESRRVKG